MLKTTLQIKTLGTLLIEKRKEKNLEIKDVSQIVKIRSTYLQALEEGNYEVFPSEVYITGFLKNYAKFLGIDIGKVMAMYRRENERQTEDNTMISKLKASNFNYVMTPNKIVAILAGIAILLILVYLGSYIGRVLKKPSLSLSSPVTINQEGEANYRTDANFIELSGNAEIGSKLTINGQELKLNNFEKFSKEFPLESGKNVFTVKSENQFGRDTTITLAITKEAGASNISPTPSVAPKTINATIEVVKKDTNITITIDGEKKTDRLYKVGSMLEFTAFKTFELKATTQSSIQLKINGTTESLSTTNSWEIVNDQVVRK